MEEIGEVSPEYGKYGKVAWYPKTGEVVINWKNRTTFLSYPIWETVKGRKAVSAASALMIGEEAIRTYS
jgi:hypothetical protein